MLKREEFVRVERAKESYSKATLSKFSYHTYQVIDDPREEGPNALDGIDVQLPNVGRPRPHANHKFIMTRMPTSQCVHNYCAWNSEANNGPTRVIALAPVGRPIYEPPRY